MNRICNTCNLETNNNNYLKDRTVWKSCFNKNRRKNNNTLIRSEQPKIDNDKGNENSLNLRIIEP